MGWAAESFRENMNLEHHESLKIFMFLLKAVSAIAYIFVLGYFAAGGLMEDVVWLMLLIGAVFDLVPELFTLHIMGTLPPKVQQAEATQLVLAVLAYIILAVTLVDSINVPLFEGYAAFTVVWLISFMVQQGVFFIAIEHDIS